jgi:hypothetical protein
MWDDAERRPLVADSNSTPDYVAWLGDALQKLDVKQRLQRVDERFVSRVCSNSWQKQFMLNHYPERVKGMEGRSDHSYGTVFERNYYLDTRFRNKFVRVAFGTSTSKQSFFTFMTSDNDNTPQ